MEQGPAKIIATDCSAYTCHVIPQLSQPLTEITSSNSLAKHDTVAKQWGCSKAKNSIDNNYNNVYSAIIMTKVIVRVHPVHMMNVD